MRFLVGIAAGLGSLLLAGAASAQCIMCSQSLAGAPGGRERAYATLLTAALVLLVPVLSMLAGVAALLWRHRGS
jgi:hypothetical protein